MPDASASDPPPSRDRVRSLTGGPGLPTGGSPDNLGFLLSRLGAWSADRFTARLGPFRLELKHAAILHIVGTSGGISQQELAERLGLPASRMVALIDDLEGRGLVERRRNPRDRRAYELGLTGAGAELAERLAVEGAAHEQDITEPLDDEEREQLRALLQRLVTAQEPPDARPTTSESPPR